MKNGYISVFVSLLMGLYISISPKTGYAQNSDTTGVPEPESNEVIENPDELGVIQPVPSQINQNKTENPQNPQNPQNTTDNTKNNTTNNAIGPVIEPTKEPAKNQIGNSGNCGTASGSAGTGSDGKEPMIGPQIPACGECWTTPRLEMVGAATGFGAWNGVGISILAQSILSQTNTTRLDNPTTFLLGTGLAATASVGYFFASDALYQNLYVQSGGARLFSTSLGWGAAYGLHISSILNGSAFADNAGIHSTVLLAGALLGSYAGAGASLGTMTAWQPDLPWVSMMNTAGILGAYSGFLLNLNYDAGPAAEAGILLGLNTLGLVGGVFLGNAFAYNYEETLIGDLGAVIGSIVGVSVGGLLVLVIPGLPDSAKIGVVTGSTWAFTMFGWVGTGSMLAYTRYARGDAVLRPEPKAAPDAKTSATTMQTTSSRLPHKPAFRLSPPTLSVALDQKQNAVPLLAVSASW